jgi:hypothetical protein
MEVTNPVKFSSLFVAAVAASVALAGCNGANNAISGAFGGSGDARAIDASGSTNDTNLSLTADNTQINTGLNATTPVGVYSKVSAGNISFGMNDGAGTASVTSGISVSVAPSTNYSIVLEGEPGAPDFILFGFADTNALPSANTVRFKVNDAAPNMPTNADVYFWPTGNGIPSSPIVSNIGLNQDTGSMPDAPGNAYIPATGSSQTIAAGTYNVAIVPTGTVANGSTDLFDGTTPMLNLNTSYSFTIGDNSATQNDIGVILATDEPFTNSNQSTHVIHLLNKSRKRL